MNESSGRERLYLAFAVLGFIVPVALLGYYFIDSGFDLGRMFDDAAENTVALAVLCDITIAALVFWSWAVEEGPRLGIRRWWLVFPATLLVGLCFAFPLFLYWRERALHGTAGAPAPA
ncbi:hypothetical protein BH20ACT15_BH20ACT15_07110 [soil metagenome]